MVGDELDVDYGASMRLVDDLGDPDRTLAILPAASRATPSTRTTTTRCRSTSAANRPVPWNEEAIEKATDWRLLLAKGDLRAGLIPGCRVRARAFIGCAISW